jgi:hypothetical protein
LIKEARTKSGVREGLYTEHLLQGLYGLCVCQPTVLCCYPLVDYGFANRVPIEILKQTVSRGTGRGQREFNERLRGIGTPVGDLWTQRGEKQADDNRSRVLAGVIEQLSPARKI